MYGQELLEAEAEETAATIAAGLGDSGDALAMQQIQVVESITFAQMQLTLMVI